MTNNDNDLLYQMLLQSYKSYKNEPEIASFLKKIEIEPSNSSILKIDDRDGEHIFGLFYSDENIISDEEQNELIDEIRSKKLFLLLDIKSDNIYIQRIIEINSDYGQEENFSGNNYKKYNFHI